MAARSQADEYLRLIAQENLRLERLAESFLTLSRLDGQRGHGGGLSFRPVRRWTRLLTRSSSGCGPGWKRPGAISRLAKFRRPFTFPADARSADDRAGQPAGKRARNTPAKTSTSACAAYLESEQVCFEISDNGQGIDPDEQGRIFERFYQSDRRLARAHDGCGLGLSLVQSIVRAHGGTVSVQSALGRGSVFTCGCRLRNRAMARPGVTLGRFKRGRPSGATRFPPCFSWTWFSSSKTTPLSRVG